MSMWACLAFLSPVSAQQPKLRHTLGNLSHYVGSVVFSSDGKTLVSGSGDNLIGFWNVASGKNTAILRGHRAARHPPCVRPFAAAR